MCASQWSDERRQVLCKRAQKAWWEGQRTELGKIVNSGVCLYCRNCEVARQNNPFLLSSNSREVYLNVLHPELK